MQAIPAIYQHGLLHPLQTLSLPEASRVWLRVSVDEDERFMQQVAQLQQLLAAYFAETTATIRHLLPKLLQTDLYLLWQLAPMQKREVCTMLALATQNLNSNHLTHEQLKTLQVGIQLLAQKNIPEDALNTLHHNLIAVNLPPIFSLNEATLNQYLDDL